MYAQTQQLPVSTTQIDQSTINNNLPNGNDVWPSINIPPQMPKEMASAIVANFRMMAQTRLNKSPLHVFAYNMLAQNRFNNNLMQEWCQRAIDFADFLVAAQNNPPQQAVEKTIAMIYQCYLAVLGSHYPSVAQQLPQDAINLLAKAGQDFNQIQQDLQAYRSRQGSGGYGNNGGALPQIGRPGHINNGPAALLSTMGSAQAAYAGGQSQSTRGVSMLVDEPKRQSWDAKPQQTQAEPEPAVDEGFEPIVDVKDIIMDPRAYVPKGFEVDPQRPFDELRAPGGIVVKPAFLVRKDKSWKWTAGDDQPYIQSYDASSYIRFLVKWPSGVVKELIVPADKQEMEYLLHEINDELRAKASRPNGLIIARTSNIIDMDSEAKPLEKVKVELDEGLDVEDAVDPVILPDSFSGASDLENERNARLTLVQELGLAKDQPIPSHEYRSVKFHPFEITGEAAGVLENLVKAESYETVAVKLNELLDAGQLSIRYHQLLCKRLVDAINDYMADSLGLTFKIGDFIEDGPQISAHIGRKKGAQMQRVFDDSIKHILGRSVWMAQLENEEEDEPTYGLVDRYINLQVGWTQQDLQSLEVGDKPVLLSQYTHPRISRAILGMIRRAAEAETLEGHRVRLITAEGVYFEVIRGKLVKNAVLLKRL